MAIHVLNPEQKAFTINMSSSVYGTFAEIGAGQEVARTFFHAGGAAGTIAKTISAYDMSVSDAIYGKEESGRYVCQPRLKKMLKREYDQLIDRLGAKRPPETTFFAYATTAAAKSYRSDRECHAWLGVKFQIVPKGAPCEVIVHVKMLDKENLQQQQALGIVGVNLIYACYNHTDDPEKFVSSLMDSVTPGRVEIDMIEVDGPAFMGIDSRILSLQLVKLGYTDCVLFDSYGNVRNASDELYKKNVLILRGSWRPPTLVNMDMLETGVKLFKERLGKNSSVMALPEISMSKLKEKGEIDNNDFLARVDLLASLGERVLITNFTPYHDLAMYLRKYTSKSRMGFVLGVYNLEEIMDESKYTDTSSGVLGAMGMIIGHNTELLLYPATESDQGGGALNCIVNSENLNVKDSKKILIKYLKKEGNLIDINDFNPKYSGIWSRQVLKMIQEDEEGWEKMVPELVADLVKDKQLFGYLRKD
ncbi:MAG: TonB-dependent receptor [Bacteriovoracaceae bacterium]